jgi:hypothetical protein
MWPAIDEERRRQLIGEMDKCLVRLDAVLDPAAGSDEDQAIDLVSGLEVRKPAISRFGCTGYFSSRTQHDSIGQLLEIASWGFAPNPRACSVK